MLARDHEQAPRARIGLGVRHLGAGAQLRDRGAGDERAPPQRERAKAPTPAATAVVHELQRFGQAGELKGDRHRAENRAESVPDGRARARHYARDMAKSHKHDEPAGETHVDGEGSAVKRMSRLARHYPATALALAAGVGALMGAELLAAGLAGGAAVLLLQRSDLRGRARKAMENARQRLHEGVRTIEHHA